MECDEVDPCRPEGVAAARKDVVAAEEGAAAARGASVVAPRAGVAARVGVVNGDVGMKTLCEVEASFREVEASFREVEASFREVEAEWGLLETEPRVEWGLSNPLLTKLIKRPSPSLLLRRL